MLFRAHQLIGDQRACAEAADGERRTIEGEGRNDRVNAGAVRQAGIDHGRGFVHAAPYARDDAVDDLHEVAIVAEDGVNPLENAALLDEDVIFAVDQDVGYLEVSQKGFQGSQTEDFVEKIGLNLLLLVETERDALSADDLADHSGDGVTRLRAFGA